LIVTLQDERAKIPAVIAKLCDFASHEFASFSFNKNVP